MLSEIELLQWKHLELLRALEAQRVDAAFVDGHWRVAFANDQCLPTFASDKHSALLNVDGQPVTFYRERPLTIESLSNTLKTNTPNLYMMPWGVWLDGVQYLDEHKSSEVANLTAALRRAILALPAKA